MDFAEQNDIPVIALKVWFENADSIEPKLPLVEDYDLSGIAIWRIGFEDDRGDAERHGDGSPCEK